MDWFLNLPETPLLTIVSFLPFKEAARTSILSKRWNGIWRSTRNIEFNEHFFANADANRDVQRQVFVEFVKNWIKNCPQPDIDKLSLTLSHPRNFQGEVEDCVAFALARNVKHLVLDFSDPTWDQDDLFRIAHPTSFDLPLSVYEHQVLESLTLISCNFNVNGFKNFGLLKNLSLGWIELPVSTLKALLVNCGCLESLSLKSCWNSGGLSICGRDLKLRTLVVYKCIMFTNPYLEIEAPNLKCLKYSGTPAVFDVSRTYLEDAELDFGLGSECDESIGDILCQLLEEISPMRALTVCAYMLQVAPMSPDNILGMTPGFSTRHLTMKTAMHDYEQYGIQFFLHSCPLLETLTIEVGPARILYHEYEAPAELNPRSMWTRNPIVFQCITQTLREVKMKGFKGTRNEMYVLHYLVRYGRVMEKLTVITSREVNNRGNPEVYRLRAEPLLIMRRASQNLHITVT